MIVSTDDCIFCKIGTGVIPSHKVYEDEKSFAFLDINPITKGHTLVIPKNHYTRLAEVDPLDLQALMTALQKVAAGIEEALDPEGLNIFINQGEVAGQVVPHLHIHVVPRTSSDGLEFITPHLKLSEKEFIEVSEKIKKIIGV